MGDRGLISRGARLTTAALLLTLASLPAEAGERWTAYDGDTLYRYIDTRRTLSRERVRLVDVDTPEIRGQCVEEIRMAIAAREVVIQALARAVTIELERTGRVDRNGRTLGRVYVDGRSVSMLLLEAGLARPYHGERRLPWC